MENKSRSPALMPSGYNAPASFSGNKMFEVMRLKIKAKFILKSQSARQLFKKTIISGLEKQ